MAKITAEEARALLDYNPETGMLRWKINNGRACAGAEAGSVNARGYREIRISYRLYYGHRLAWLIVTGKWPKAQIDHQNEIKGDDRWENLREATNQQNHGNLTGYRNNTSGFKGVSWDKHKGKWEAYIAINCRKKSLGRFDSAEEAHAAYKVAAAAHFGEFARFGP